MAGFLWFSSPRANASFGPLILISSSSTVHIEPQVRLSKLAIRIFELGQQAEIVRKIFDLYRHGERSLPLGIKGITNHLNQHGFQNRKGGRFSIKVVHEILTRTAYIGRHRFNVRCNKDGKLKAPDEVVEMAVPPIVEDEAFWAVQATLKRHNPKQTPPRVVNGPCLLTGLARCATCDGAMTLRTGKSGRYRYYTCLTCVRMGKTAGKGRSIPMDTLDGTVKGSNAGQSSA